MLQFSHEYRPYCSQNGRVVDVVEVVVELVDVVVVVEVVVLDVVVVEVVVGVTHKKFAQTSL